MALCLADSLIASQGFDAADQMQRYLRWWKKGERSSKPGVCFDIGSTVRAALRRFEQNGEPYAGVTDPRTAGNGSLMRLAPVAMFYASVPNEALTRAADSSRTTHGALEAVDACRYFTRLLLACFDGGRSKEAIFDASAALLPSLAPSIRSIASGSYRDKPAAAIRASGYVVHTLEAALWAFYHSESFEQGALLAVNLGEDADTTGAVYGQLAGAFYGAEAIPQRWRDRLYEGAEILSVAERLHEVGGHSPIPR
jgi:ADP-ribosyl-[dinitrogen reductase] hydrolase